MRTVGTPFPGTLVLLCPEESVGAPEIDVWQPQGVSHASTPNSSILRLRYSLPSVIWLSCMQQIWRPLHRANGRRQRDGSPDSPSLWQEMGNWKQAKLASPPGKQQLLVITSSHLRPLLRTERQTGQNGSGLVFEARGASWLEILLTLKYLWVRKSEQQEELEKKIFF